MGGKDPKEERLLVRWVLKIFLAHLLSLWWKTLQSFGLTAQEKFSSQSQASKVLGGSEYPGTGSSTYENC